MERKPHHQQEDPTLRTEFIQQTSLDEFLTQHAPVFLMSDAPEIIGAALHARGIDASFDDAWRAAKDAWGETLHPLTSFNEYLYLEGRTSKTDRDSYSHNMRLKMRQAAIDAGVLHETDDQ